MAGTSSDEEIRRLLRVAADRNAREEYGTVRVRLLRSEIAAFRRRLAEERVSANVFFEAVIRGYLRGDPSAAAMVEDWARHARPEAPESRSRSASDRELDEIYAAIDGGMMADEEE